MRNDGLQKRNIQQMTQELTPQIMLGAYAAGLFPMASDATDTTLRWYDPDPRGILPLDGFHLPRRLRRTVLSGQFEVCVDRDFPPLCAHVPHLHRGEKPHG